MIIDEFHEQYCADFVCLIPGPGCYFHETSLVKPSFNKLATDSSLQKPSALNGESFAETRHGSVRSLINCSFGPTGPIQRSTLLERRDIKSTLRDLIQRNASLETLIKTQEQILLENIREQTELSEERFVKARGKQPKQTLQASDDFPSTPNLSEFEEECGDIDDFYNYYNSK